jgi:hypothetical protein
MLLSDLLSGLAGKLAGGLAAKAALALGIATATVTGAGAAGVLPGPAQHAVATVVNAVSPLDIPDTSDLVKVDTTKVTDPTALLGDEDEGVDNEVGDDQGGQPKDNHGACVSAVAKDKSTVGREHGLAVSTAAKSDCGKEGTTTSSSTSSTSSTTTTSTTLGGTSTAAQLDDGGKGKGNSGGNSGPSANRGQGNSNSNGRGNSGK